MKSKSFNNDYRAIGQFILLIVKLMESLEMLQAQPTADPVAGSTGSAAMYKPIDFAMLDQRVKLGYESGVAFMVSIPINTSYNLFSFPL